VQLTRRRFLLATAGAAACSRQDSQTGLRKAAQYLWAQQAEDGGWHSHTYGLLRSGQSLTPFVLDALLDLDERPKGVAGAIDFIRRNVNQDGSLGLMDSIVPDYPNYATGLGVRALVRAKVQGWENMVACLRAQQFCEENGWHRDHPSYGAWGMGGGRRRPPEPGHVDLAMTRYVLEGLAAAGVRPPDPALERAQVFLERCQNPDGGFFFSTVNTDTNKAGEDGERYRSYGTATADGIVALDAVGAAGDDARIKRARKWLREHHQPNRVAGFQDGPRYLWSEGLRFYYAAAIVRAAPGLPVLLPPQRADGSFRNSVNLVKEDDPLIATAFAVRVLCNHKGE
jgi:hypothetical protein